MCGEDTEKYWSFFQEKPLKTLILLKKEEKEMYQAKIAKKVDMTYAHTLKVLNMLKELKLLRFSESGRSKFAGLSELGEEVANRLFELVNLIKLAEIDREIDKIYYKHIKGKLPEEIDKEVVKQKYEAIKLKLAEYFEKSEKKISLFSRNLTSRVNKILEEVLGYPIVTEIPHEESQT